MKRLWHTWIVFGMGLAVVLVAMGWLSAMVLRLDRAQAEAERQAALEENVRLALWRMDSALTGLIAQENAHPYFYYSPFYAPERAYDGMFAQFEQGEVLMPSPLLTRAPSHVWVHFQFAPDGRLTSPQVPGGNMLDLAEARYTKYEKIKVRADRLQELRGKLTKEALLAQLRVTGCGLREKLETRSSKPASNQMLRASQEAQARFTNVGQELSQRQAVDRAMPLPPGAGEEMIKPVWLGEMLLLARTVTVNRQKYIQGCWLDWPAIRKWLLESVNDLLPQASLVPVKEKTGADPARSLAALPVRLVPGTAPAYPGGGASPVLMSLVVAWICVLVGAAAVGVLLSGAVSLSERRAAFVSAVTHELRTPLSTFRMYTEMLTEGMVPDEEKRRQYLKTLHTEAERLTHLVENVLAYARLERGRPGGRSQTMTLRELLDRIKSRLAERAERSRLTLTVEAPDNVLEATARADLSAVEQILFNLVDNACKYAASATNKTIHLQASLASGFVALRVRDHGPGIARTDRSGKRRLFRPFSKSAADAAGGAPGVGLGLALSRRLARQMGGDLQFDNSITDGACFVLTLPAR